MEEIPKSSTPGHWGVWCMGCCPLPATPMLEIWGSVGLLCASHTRAVLGRVELEWGGSGCAWKHAVLPPGTCCINRSFARAAKNVRAGAASTWCRQKIPDPCAGQGADQSTDTIVPWAWQGRRMLKLEWGAGVLEREKPSRHPQFSGSNLSPKSVFCCEVPDGSSHFAPHCG